MSADNWTRCPRCTTRGTDKLDQREAAVQASYGKVPVEKFDEARRDLAVARTAFEKRPPTFREDYEFCGAETGTVTASYYGSCTVCGLELHFAAQHPIPDWNKP